MSGTVLRRQLAAAFLAFSTLPCASFAQQRPALHGTVFDAATRQPIPAAVIRILGTTQGTIANAAGQYTLQLPTDARQVTASALGYRPDTLFLSSPLPAIHDFSLEPSAILLPEVVVTSEDPAIGIIRKAIARKHQWIDRLASFTMEAFTRQVLRRDTAIASITEAYTRGYWRAGDTLREVVVHRRQTANIRESFNFASVGVILNFNEDRIRFVGYEFVGPTADDALDYYDYKLLRTRTGEGRTVYDIRMIPRTRTTPLFQGTVSIEGDTYALAGVDVGPNDAFSIPFVREHQLRYRQQFALYDSLFWMPTDIRISGRFVIGIPAIALPPIGFEQTSVISSYMINVPVPDSVFRKPRLSVDSLASRTDSSRLGSRTPLPLTPEEDSAYATIDSSKTLEVQFRPGGMAATLESGSLAGAAISHLDLAFNRVEGFHAGLRAQVDSLSPYLQVRGTAAYGFSSKYASASAGATIFTSPLHKLGVGAEWFHQYERTPGWFPYNALLNSLNALFFKNDYYDYYRTEGWSAHLLFAPLPTLTGKILFTSEWELNAPKATDYSFIYPRRDYRANPAAREGKLGSLRMDVRLGRQNVLLDFVTTNVFGFSIEHASPSLASSDFSFTQYNIYGTIALPTFGRSFLFKPQLRLRVAAGTSTGDLPRQRYFSVETASGLTAGFGAMRAMGVKEFVGTRYMAVSLEHNFRSIPFLALGLPFLYKNNVELILHGGTANAWGGDGVPLYGWYYEAGLSLNRIFELGRVDATWRLSPPGGFSITFGIANLF